MPAALLATLPDLQWIVWPVLAIVFTLGLVATFAPGRFQTIASQSGKWIDTDKIREALDKPIDVDQHVLRYSRVFGVLVAVAAVWLGYVYWTIFRS
jgi:hypothetical protein